MKKTIVIPNPNKDQGFCVTKLLINKLLSLGFSVYLDKTYFMEDLNNVVYYSSVPTDADFIAVVGGDGSVIDASSIAVMLNIPIIGVNLGKVGYLATVDPLDLDILDRIQLDRYEVTEKMLLCAEAHYSNCDPVSCSRLAFNDIVISHDTYLGITEFKLENSSGDQIEYRADGVIISTPAGSTAYSLSAGGPIVSHSLDSITVTPVCPHSFFNRSIVYGPDECIRISNSANAILKISVDGRFFAELQKGDSCLVFKSPKRLKMISFGVGNGFSTLFNKIKIIHDSV